MSITKKFILLFLLISLIPISVISFFSYITAKEAVTRQVIRQLEFIADLQKGRINALIDQNLERLANATVQVERESSASAIFQSLLQIRASNPHFLDVSLLDNVGTIVSSTDPRMVSRSVAGEEYFQRGKDGHVIGNFFLDERGQVSMYLSGPVRSFSMLGSVIAVKSDIDTFRNLIREYDGLGETGELLLAKSDGVSDAVFIAPSRFNANAALREKIPLSKRDDPMILALSKKHSIVTDTIDYRGKHTLAVTRYIDRAGWGLVVKMDRDEAFTYVYRLGSYFFYTALITGFLAILNAWYFSHYITHPILLLSRAADAIRNGNLSTTIDVYTKDEIGQLADTFRDMAQKLKTSYGELSQKVSEKTAELAGKVQERDQQIAKDQALLASIGDGVIVTDEHEMITIVNVTAQELLKCPQGQLLNRKFQDAIKLEVKKNIVVTEHKNPITAALLLRRKISTNSIGEVSFFRSDGAKFPVGLTVTPVMLGGSVIGTILVFRDMTVAQEIDRMKTEFISLASHQLRTPLSAIRWFVDMLREGDAGKLNDQQSDIAENISAANNRMIDLVNNLLNLSRLESGKIASDPQPTNLAQLIETLIKELNVTIDAGKLKVIVEAPDAIPTIIIDPRLTREVFMNLLTNAIKYTPAGGNITIHLSQKGNAVLTSVSDTGCGIPVKEHNRVFDKFFRGGNVSAAVTDGTGLGLYLVKEIVTSCGGGIWFDSAEGKGTTFYVTLPIHPPHPLQKTSAS